MSHLLLLFICCFTLKIVSGRPILLSGEIKVSVISSRNKTGHWNTQVQVEHGDNDGLPLQVDVDHSSSKRDGLQSILIIANITAPPQRPGPDYELLPNLGYYKFHNNPKNWSEARTACEKEGAHLVIINSEEESKALRRLWIPHPKMFDDWRNSWAHVGVHDIYSEGNYVTIFDVPLNETGFNQWNSGQPNGGTTQNCVVMHRNNGGLGDADCKAMLAFICEKEF